MPARSRFGLSYNGEVYNAPELRAELEAAGRKFPGHSDTRFAVWGAADRRACLPYAAWDCSTPALTLERNRN
jgi:asparagine synthase (glutamine-hydrolysing)